MKKRDKLLQGLDSFRQKLAGARDEPRPHMVVHYVMTQLNSTERMCEQSGIDLSEEIAAFRQHLDQVRDELVSESQARRTLAR